MPPAGHVLPPAESPAAGVRARERRAPDAARWTPGRMSSPPPLRTRIGRRGHNGGDPPGRNPGWVPEVGGSEPPAEGIHKDTDGPDLALFLGFRGRRILFLRER